MPAAAETRGTRAASRKDSLHDGADIVGQQEVAAVGAVGQSGVIEAKQLEHRRVQVVDVHLVVHGLLAEIVGGAVDGAALDAAPGEPDAERVVVVIATGSVVAIAVARGGAAEFASPDDDGAVE